MDTISFSTPHTTAIDSPDTTCDFLKMEDVHASSPPPASYTQSTPAPVIVHSRPAKKRKSWGQELPEPKTALPPRKRAKTDDEKEQRRIERIKRNRAAAHNSRERKRQETETYAVALARARAELDAYRQHFGALPSNIVLPEVTLSTLPEDESTTPVPSLIESNGTPLADDLFEPTNVIIKQEPSDLTFSPFIPPPTFALPESTSKSSPALSLLDPTQHSAAMLCDLQCRSSQRSSSRSSTYQPTSLPPTFWATLFLHLLNLSLTSTYKTTLLALWSLSPSRMARSMQASRHRSTSPSTTTSTTLRIPRRLSPLTSAALAQRNAATRLDVRRRIRGATTALPQSRIQVVDDNGRSRGGEHTSERQQEERAQGTESQVFRTGSQGNGQADHGVQGR